MIKQPSNGDEASSNTAWKAGTRWALQECQGQDKGQDKDKDKDKGEG